MLLTLNPGSSQPPWHREGLGPQGVGTGAWAAGCMDGGQMGTHSCLSLLFLTAPLQLEQALDTGVPGHLGGPGGLILSTLWGPSGGLSPSRRRAILCILRVLVSKRTPWAGAGGRAGFSCWLSRGSPGRSRQLPVSNHLAKPPVPEVSYYTRTLLVGEAPHTLLTDCDLGKLRAMEWSY